MNLSEIAQQVAADVEKQEEAAKKSDANGMPEWAKQMASDIKALKGYSEGVAQNENNNRVAELLMALAESTQSHKEKAIKNMKRMRFESDDDFKAFLEDEKSYAQFLEQESTNSKLGKDFPKPGVPGFREYDGGNVIDEVFKLLNI
ncbi:MULTISPECIES: hypothetical protein [Olivibacter]|uniref:Uncharacterized protein n=1 Tax=Olivibacter jilunii TaxID=985016 RepID=A0ABW6AUY5_9SPHI